jgi:general secretion pathway protein D
MVILSRATLTTLSDQQASLEISRKEAQLAGTATASRVTTHSIRDQNVGTIIKINPRVGPDKRITLRVDVEDFRFGPAEENAAIAASKEGESPRARSIENFRVKSTLTVADGETVVLGGVARQPKPGTERLLLVTPRIQPTIRP